jgi:hypothetical protein
MYTHGMPWFLKKLKRFWGWFFIAFAIVGIGTEIDNAKQGKSEKQGVGVAMILIMGTADAALLRSGYRRELGLVSAHPAQTLVRTNAPPEPVDSVRNALVTCAETHGWRLTITDAASDLNLSFGAARDALEALVKAGECTSETVDGRVVYQFDSHRKRVAAISQRR